MYLHPWAMIVGVAAAGLPVLIHFLTRPRPVRMPLSTLRFVREAIRQRAARHRLRDFVILTLRTAAVLLLAWAVARPLVGPQAAAAADGDAPVARVVVVDVSQSLAAQVQGIAVFERARAVAAGHLGDQLGLQANLVLAGATARPVFERFSPNFGALRDELGRARPRPERLNVAAALTLAGELLAKTAPVARRELVLVSDFQRSNWAAADFAAVPQDTLIRLESVAPAEAPANVAVLRAGAVGRVEQGREARLEVEVGNFSPTPRQVQAEVVLGDASYRVEGLCPAGGKAVLTAGFVPRAVGWQTGAARLLNVQDGLSADDSRAFVVEVRPPPAVALLTRQRADQRPSASYYLERALAPFEPRPGGPGLRVTRHDPANLDREAVAAADLMALDHPGKLTAPAVQLLANLVRRGRGLLYVTAEAGDAANLRLLADALGSAWQLPVEFQPPPAGQRRRDLFLLDVRRDRPPWRVFGDGLPAVTSGLRFGGGLASRALDAGLADDVLASYGDRSACLVVSACGAGTVAVLNTDLAASNLPGSPAFVPLMGELLDRLLGQAGAADAAPSGEPLAAALPVAAGPLAGLTLGGGEAAGQLAEEGGGVLWRAAAAPAPGAHVVRRGDAVVFALATAVPAEESDLQALAATVFQERLAGGRAVVYRDATAAGEERDTFWTWLAVGCVLCLLGEVVALRAFRT